MSEKNIPEQLKRDAVGEQITAVSPPQPTRRRLLKSTVAIPVIMTLHSGAALARSSNMLTPVEAGDAVRADNGRYVCVNAVSEEGPPYDVGDTPTATLVDNAEDCQAPTGILVSSGAYQSLQGKGMTLPDL